MYLVVSLDFYSLVQKIKIDLSLSSEASGNELSFRAHLSQHGHENGRVVLALLRTKQVGGGRGNGTLISLLFVPENGGANVDERKNTTIENNLNKITSPS